MNDKLKEYRDKLAENWMPPLSIACRSGFDAAIQLNLAVEFLQWCDQLLVDGNKGFFYDGSGTACLTGQGLVVLTTAELYNHWLDNVWVAK